MAARCVLLLSFALITGCAARDSSPPTVQTARTSTAALSVTHENLNAVLWMQSALEYEASTLQAFRLARAQLDAGLAQPQWTAALEQSGDPGGLPPAIIVDVDETVLDNSYYQARLVRDGANFTEETWNRWCEEARATAVPGALEFTQYAARHGVAVFYVTNRMHEVEHATRANLAALGFPLHPGMDTVLTRGERPEWQASAKGPRREHVAREFRVVLQIGDDLGDFVTDTSGTPEERRARTAQHADRWGHHWIMLPNPTYGSWERAIAGTSPEPIAAKRQALRVDPP